MTPGGFACRALLRTGAATLIGVTFVFLLNNYLTYWRGWPGIIPLAAARGWIESAAPAGNAGETALGWIQLAGYAFAVLLPATLVFITRSRSLRADAALYAALAAYIVRGAFWAVVLVGLADMAISFLRVEDLLPRLVGEHLTRELGRSVFRGTYVHYPLVVTGYAVALFSRSLGFTWLALLVVVAEFQIVISRFVFSYEQAFMGDLVRFWYAALFLFASAHALIDEGHVRVDVLYAGFSRRGKAWSNTLGSLFLGLPLCWVILTQGMWGKGSSINSPLLSFEISQSGFGMYVKYLMAGFLVVFAVSMIAQFAGYLLRNAADLIEESQARTPVCAGDPV